MPLSGGLPASARSAFPGAVRFLPAASAGGVFSASAIALVESIANAKIQAIVFFIAGFISFI